MLYNKNQIQTEFQRVESIAALSGIAPRRSIYFHAFAESRTRQANNQNYRRQSTAHL